ncbi:MAG: site-specific DNA-methyltransferase, partial [Oscillospiraceae bacterium]|nr:site-specific DNA-methyltransferase [Oscillospiraceae bacterium]
FFVIFILLFYHFFICLSSHLCEQALDPFHGSGTLGVCCEKLNKQGHKIRWVGIELEEKWCEIAIERLNRI